MSVEVTVDITRETQAGYVGPSMKTRVAYSANAADPDYRATNVTNRRIFKNATLVIQSGGQYDGQLLVALNLKFIFPFTY